MKRIIDTMHVNEAIARWQAAGYILDMHNGDRDAAENAIEQHIGRGINSTEADTLMKMVETLANERK